MGCDCKNKKNGNMTNDTNNDKTLGNKIMLFLFKVLLFVFELVFEDGTLNVENFINNSKNYFNKNSTNNNYTPKTNVVDAEIIKK